MNELSTYAGLVPRPQKTSWASPSNIAFVKYWGKKGHQLPANPSLSMTLSECITETEIEFTPDLELKVDLYLSGTSEVKFAQKIETYLRSLSTDLPWLAKMSIIIRTKNTFPHGAGIASSASGLSAIALCLADYLYALNGQEQDAHFFQLASHLGRLASGSACRSVYGGFTTWGDESDLHASVIEVHPELNYLHDTVLVINDAEKSVSSRAGHERMNEHAYAQARFIQAKANYRRMKEAMRAGDLLEMGRILENEALSLHAMMLTSPDSFTLLKPNTLSAMEMIKCFRHETKLPLFFTLDAGPNLHLIYPSAFQPKIDTFINNELMPLTTSIIFDGTGEGPQKCP